MRVYDSFPAHPANNNKKLVFMSKRFVFYLHYRLSASSLSLTAPNKIEEVKKERQRNEKKNITQNNNHQTTTAALAARGDIAIIGTKQTNERTNCEGENAFSLSFSTKCAIFLNSIIKVLKCKK